MLPLLSQLAGGSRALSRAWTLELLCGVDDLVLAGFIGAMARAMHRRAVMKPTSVGESISSDELGTVAGGTLLSRPGVSVLPQNATGYKGGFPLPKPGPERWLGFVIPGWTPGL